jgi:hypothetical protein
MKFLYKIYSRYDNFTPRRIPERLLPGNKLQLGWKRYIDLVEVGDEVWVYFHGPHKFENGVYVEGIVQEVNVEERFVLIRARDYSVDRPLTDAATSRRVAEVVAPMFLQVFLYPQEWVVSPQCTVDTVADSCERRQCGSCSTWQALPLIEYTGYHWPRRLPKEFTDFVPAFWVIPRRCYLRGEVARPVRHTSELFYRFKMGEQALAYPLARGIYESLRMRKTVDFDGVVPIPLSPDKAEANEIHRTRLLANELAKLLGIRVADVLSLNRAISKRQLFSLGYTRRDFEDAYYKALSVGGRVTSYQRLLLLDDVCTEGTTLRCALQRIREVHPSCEVSAVTAGQMIVKAVVRDESGLRP